LKSVIHKIPYKQEKCNLCIFFLHIFFYICHTIAESISKGGVFMNCHANKCIECTVKSCAYHCDSENYCSLDRILVGTHEANPTQDQCTDCKSFRKR